ncbi:MAG TPA: cyclic pyranopterin monophosphate synthase MoaC [Polyangiaceae bacterium]|nr:cyclic pyranopterin monophosphate synthase MoaC [Polyangiaceae bacterium]
MKLYSFDGVDATLDLLPLAARRALDLAGLKLSLDAWRALPVAVRRAVVESGSGSAVDLAQLQDALVGAPVTSIERGVDPDISSVPPELSEVLGAGRPISQALWNALSPLDRYALVKVVGRGKPERIDAAYAEIVGHSALSTHLAPGGGARMVDVAQKTASLRRAVAESRVSMSADAFTRVKTATVPKGDVLGTARLAGIMGAKRTAELIPLCHPLALTKLDLSLELDDQASAIAIRATVEAFDRTGVEMEALTAVSVAALTVYDMLKGIDRAMEIGPTRLVAKSGGRSGDFAR